MEDCKRKPYTVCKIELERETKYYENNKTQNSKRPPFSNYGIYNQPINTR